MNDVPNDKAWLENRGTSFELTNGITGFSTSNLYFGTSKMLTSRLRSIQPEKSI